MEVEVVGIVLLCKKSVVMKNGDKEGETAFIEGKNYNALLSGKTKWYYQAENEQGNKDHFLSAKGENRGWFKEHFDIIRDIIKEVAENEK